MIRDTAAPSLPDPLHSLLDGRDLADKIGPTILLSSADGSGRVRQALLSVGEVVALDRTDLRLALYANSRTTAALEASGHGLLTMVVDGTTYKVEIDAERVSSGAAGGAALALFTATVVAVDEDAVGYARVLHGIEYELPDPAPVVERWQRQVEQMLEVDRDRR